LPQVAQLVNKSPQYFSKIFHEKVGVKFNDYINMVRVEKVKEILSKKPKLPVTEIFLLSGFESIPNFNRVFKKIEGCSPKKYRNNLHIKAS